MLEKIKLENILFLDIETVPGTSVFEQLPEKMQSLWDKKSGFFRKDEELAEDVYSRAGIFAEFGKVICISVGMTYKKGQETHFRLKSFYGDNEKDLLIDFNRLLKKLSQKSEIQLCAHNGKEFDFPYLARRMLINGLELPALLDVAGKKPWEVSFLDTMELWKFGDYKHFTSLDLLTTIFQIPTPKDDMDGSMVGDAYWKDHELEKIVKYCEKDVIAVVQLFLRYQGKSIIPDEKIEITAF